MKILYMSDFDLNGSGYLNISVPLLTGLAEKGHDIIVAGLGYRGQQHDYPFRLIPIENFQEFFAIFKNLATMWDFDVLMVAMDIPIHIQILKILKQFTGFQYKYVGIMPVESGPLCFSYSAALLQMDKVYVISQFGTEECRKMGIPAEHFQVGVDVQLWPIRNADQRLLYRSALSIDHDAFVMCTVADNQERKNLVAAMDAFKLLRDKVPSAKYILVTREHNLVGWRLRDYAMEIGISRDLIIVERGISQQELWQVMATADVFVLASKAEGLGMPLLEAMAMSIPCVATNACGMQELLANDRGWLVDYEYIHRDPFGNGKRYWINAEQLSDVLIGFAENGWKNGKQGKLDNARSYVESRTWDIPVDLVAGYLKGLENEQKA